jgi:hypothetical protein
LESFFANHLSAFLFHPTPSLTYHNAYIDGNVS